MTTLAMITPSVRLVHVVVHAGFEATPEIDHDFYEVVALVAKQHPGEPDLIRYATLVTHREYDICEFAEAIDWTGEEAHTLVTAPWDSREDEERLTDVVERLRSQARKKLASKAEALGR